MENKCPNCFEWYRWHQTQSKCIFRNNINFIDRFFVWTFTVWCLHSYQLSDQQMIALCSYLHHTQLSSLFGNDVLPVCKNRLTHHLLSFFSLQLPTPSKYLHFCMMFNLRESDLIAWWLPCELQIFHHFHQSDILLCLPLCFAQCVLCGRRHDLWVMQNTPHLVIRSLVPSGAAAFSVCAQEKDVLENAYCQMVLRHANASVLLC